MKNSKVNPMPIYHSYWVIPGRFLAGEYPGSINDEQARGKLRWLMNQGIRYFLNLTMMGEYDLKPYHNMLQDEAIKLELNITHVQIPLQDYSEPSKYEMIEILNTIDLSLSEGKNIYLHCFGGKGRTGTVVGCYLVRHGMSGEKALETINDLRKHIPGKTEQSPETVGQRRMVLEWIDGQ